jgi:hypothetical protein
MTLCGGPAIHLFSATELERLVCGNPLLDFAALQANARYEGGYGPDHRVRMACPLLRLTWRHSWPSRPVTLIGVGCGSHQKNNALWKRLG